MTPKPLSPDEWLEVRALASGGLGRLDEAFLSACLGFSVDIDDPALGYRGPVYFLSDARDPQRVIALHRLSDGSLRPIQLDPYHS